MVKNHIFLIFINIFFINEIFANDILSIPFYKSYPNLKGFSPKEITEKIKEIKLVSDISIGTPLQKIKAKLALTEYVFYIGGKDSLCQNKFIEGSSDTYTKLSDLIYFYATSIREGYSSSDIIFSMKNQKNKKK